MDRLVEIRQLGYQLQPLVLPSPIHEFVQSRDWSSLDDAIAKEVVCGGVIFEYLRSLIFFSQIEFIISIRSSLKEPDDDGIWHDDGSRILAFSLSLTRNPDEIVGGVLEIRKKGDSIRSAKLSTPPFGTMIVFATGVDGFEHKIGSVHKGERIIIPGWCT